MSQNALTPVRGTGGSRVGDCGLRCKQKKEGFTSGVGDWSDSNPTYTHIYIINYKNCVHSPIVAMFGLWYNASIQLGENHEFLWLN